MAFKKVETNYRYLKYADCEEGDIVAEGIYTGSREGQYGIQHYVREQDGVSVVLNSAGHLNYLLKEAGVKKGNLIQVTYAGTEKLEKGKYKNKDVHKFELAIDEEGGEDLGDDEDEQEQEVQERPKASKGLGKPAKRKDEEQENADQDEEPGETDSGDDESNDDRNSRAGSRNRVAASARVERDDSGRNSKPATGAKSASANTRSRSTVRAEAETQEADNQGGSEDEGQDQEEKGTSNKKMSREEVLAKFRKK